MNTWPNGIRRALLPHQHESWNASNSPGTRQICIVCAGYTERCEEDQIYIGDHGPLCHVCYSESEVAE